MPIDLGKASAKVTLLTGGHKQDFELRPAGDKLKATGSFRVGAETNAVTGVTGASKSPSTARFQIAFEVRNRRPGRLPEHPQRVVDGAMALNFGGNYKRGEHRYWFPAMASPGPAFPVASP